MTARRLGLVALAFLAVASGGCKVQENVYDHVTFVGPNHVVAKQTFDFGVYRLFDLPAALRQFIDLGFPPNTCVSFFKGSSYFDWGLHRGAVETCQGPGFIQDTLPGTN